jgi:hypothetical protein
VSSSNFKLDLDVFVGLLGLFWGREDIGVSLVAEMPYLFVYIFLIIFGS